ncbi:MAG: OmpA family protein [Chitinispirillaceae bacterium]|nr:OmpA family protein [Chitinispirillaceae bacterium]
MKRPYVIFVVSAVVIAGVFFCLSGCTKKEIKTTVLPQPEPVKDTVAAEVLVPAPEPEIDSAAIIDALLRQALQNIYFDFNNFDLKTEALNQLTAIGSVLLEHQNIIIMIEGFCDERGSSEYNVGLGENRAKAAKKWLVAYGIADSRIQTTSYGKERLAIEGCVDETCHQRNRRCEFRMISSGI